MRPLGSILRELGDLLDEMIDDHHLKWGDVRTLVMQHLQIHHSNAQEEYAEGRNPIDFYGPAESLDAGYDLLHRILQEYRVGRPRKEWRELMEEVEKLIGMIHE